MKLLTINVLGVSSTDIKVLVDGREQKLTGEALVAMLREKLSGAAEYVAVLLPKGSEFEFEQESRFAN